MKIITDENGKITEFALIGELVDGVDAPDPEDTEHFLQHYGGYVFSEGQILFDEIRDAAEEAAKRITELRERREKECYTIINRGQLWYETLSVSQLLELRTWYKAWLKVSETGTIPEKPSWLE